MTVHPTANTDIRFHFFYKILTILPTKGKLKIHLEGTYSEAIINAP